MFAKLPFTRRHRYYPLIPKSIQHGKNTDTTFFSLKCTSQYISLTKTIEILEDHVPENQKIQEQLF